MRTPARSADTLPRLSPISRRNASDSSCPFRAPARSPCSRADREVVARAGAAGRRSRGRWRTTRVVTGRVAQRFCSK
jgi:hypothetical protein